MIANVGIDLWSCCRCFFLQRPRLELFERIDLRVEQMVDRGLLQVRQSSFHTAERVWWALCKACTSWPSPSPPNPSPCLFRLHLSTVTLRVKPQRALLLSNCHTDGKSRQQNLCCKTGLTVLCCAHKSLCTDTACSRICKVCEEAHCCAGSLYTCVRTTAPDKSS